MNQLILGDCLEVMKSMPDESVDLIYLDPPFFSNRNYEVIWGDKGEVRSFEDRWAGGVMHYIEWLKTRVEQMHRLLKPTGSIYLHCDWHADAYIRVCILDKLFGENNFRNHIIWKRTNNPKGSQFKNKRYGIASDSIFWYTKGEEYYFNPTSIRTLLDNEQMLEKYPYEDQKGRYYQGPIVCGKTMGPRPNLVFEYKGFTPRESGWRLSKPKLIELDNKGDLGWSKNKYPFRKLRPESDKGQPIYNIWDDIKRIYSQSSESIGYPTQKPEALLDRIIKANSNEGEVVLDPFMGGGTTIAVAEKLGRQWIGIDQSVQAVKVTELRLQKDSGLFSSPFLVKLHKYDYDTLRYANAFEFEKFIVQAFGGTGNVKQRGDYGIDGKMPDGTPIQVKRSDGIGRNVIDNFKSACERYDEQLYSRNVSEGKPIGYIIAFSFGRGTVEEVARLAGTGIKIELVCVENIVPISKKPKLSISVSDKGFDAKHVHEVEFEAVAKSEAGIEFYSWDFDYKEESGFQASVMIDKSGVQSEKFKSGEYSIAVKAVDNDGLESLEVVRLKVNGKVEEV